MEGTMAYLPIDEGEVEAAEAIPYQAQGELSAGAVLGFLYAIERGNPEILRGARLVFMEERQNSLGNGDNFRGAAFHALVQWLEELEQRRAYGGGKPNG